MYKKGMKSEYKKLRFELEAAKYMSYLQPK